jgi:hypothetical protein
MAPNRVKISKNFSCFSAGNATEAKQQANTPLKKVEQKPAT